MVGSLRPAFVGLFSLVAVTVSAESLRLTSFENGDTAMGWQVVNDTVMGGQSSSQVKLQNNSLVFSGRLDTTGGGFASVRSDRQDWDIGQVSVVRLRVKGDGRIYKFRLFVDNDPVSYQQQFDTRNGQWCEVELPIDQFHASWRGRRVQRPALDPGDIVAVGLILADGKDGEFSLIVDWIELHDGA